VRRGLFAIAALALALPGRAHEVPADVRIHAFLKPEGQSVRLLVRVPLAALRDIDPPTRGPGYLDLGRAEVSLRTAARLWIADALELHENDVPVDGPTLVAARASLPSEPFDSYDAALALVSGAPLPDATELHWSQGMLDALLEWPIGSQASRFSIRPSFERLGLRVVTALRFLPPGGGVRAFELRGDPGLVRLDPRWHQAALRFVGLGFLHILEGIDHLLFLLCLVIPFRRLGPLVLVVTSFTVAHSVTLIAAATGQVPDALWFPPLVETLIALSIVYMALENIVAPRLGRRWVVTFGFGLVHGFGFAFALQETLQFAGSHLLTSLVSFNVGVELGQLAVLVALVPALEILVRLGVAERVGTIVLSAFAAHTGWHWMLERLERLRQFPLQWPTLDAVLLAAGLRWMMLIVAAAALAWLLFGVLLRSARRSASKEM
jgi:hypothetical protein